MIDSSARNDIKTATQNDQSYDREVWPDILRTLAVFSVIIGHMASYGYKFSELGPRTFDVQVCHLYYSLVRYCVPAFVMLSGMFMLAPERKYDLKKLYLVKIARIIAAYIFWAALYALVIVAYKSILGGDHRWYDLCRYFVQETLRGHYHLWFLFMIAGLYIVTPILRPIVRDEKITIYYLVLGFVFVYGVNLVSLFPPMRKLLAETVNRLDVKLAAGYPCYFILGYWFSRHTLSARARKALYVLGVLAAVFAAALNGFLAYHFNTPGDWLHENLLPHVVLMSSAAFVFCQYNFKGEHLSAKWKRLIGIAGKWSFGIYLVHAIFLDILQTVLPQFSRYPLVSIPLTAVVVYFVSLAAVFILDKIPVLNKYIM